MAAPSWLWVTRRIVFPRSSFSAAVQDVLHSDVRFESSYSINLFRTTDAHAMRKSVESRRTKMSTGKVE